MNTFNIKLTFALVCVIIVFCANSCTNHNTSNTIPSQQETIKAEPKYNFYGFNEADVNSWIRHAMERKHCELIEITSTKYEGGKLIIYANVKEYSRSGSYIRDNKAEIELLEQYNMPKQISEGRCYLEIN